MTFNEIIQSGKPVLVEFSAECCSSCKMMAPILKDVKNPIGDAAIFIKVDIDKNQQDAGEYQIQGAYLP